MNSVRHFLMALQFFTRVPVYGRLGEWVGYSPALLRASAAHYPGVGALVGLIGAGVLVGAASWWPHAVAAVLCTGATVWLTGAFHEDGLADTIDGLGGSADRERVLEIMRDSRIGAFGAIALVLALALKIALLAELSARGASHAGAAVLAAHALSRFAPLLVMRRLPYVGGEGGKAKPLADAVSGSGVGVAALWCLPVVLLLVAVHGAGHAVAALLGAAAITGWTVRWLRRRLGGFTGDALGATQQLAELSIYLALVARP
ncbi:MAG: adenosylcobinamide-GDP ribazoletransferase [Comamonadaceae bacterium]|nr:MAG: adenosylcobinamide-GDP ribazoletransferase [Comamonadaceae bacterium]